MKLSEAVFFQEGPGLRTHQMGENGVPFLNIRTFNDNETLDKSKCRFVKMEEFKNKYEHFLLNEGDIVVSSSGTLGKAIVIKKEDMPVMLNTSVIRFRSISEELLTQKFLKYFLKSEMFFSQIQEQKTGMAIDNYGPSHLQQMQMVLPPLKEQQRIVATLDELMEKIDRSRARLERIPKILKRFRQSILSAAVSETGNPTFTEEICEIIQIGPFGTQLHRHDYISNGIPLINPTHIQAGQVIPDAEFTISKKKFLELSNYHLKEGDVIMGRRGEMARCALIGAKEDGWLCGTGSLFFRPNNKLITPQYLYWLLSNSNTKEFLESESKGTTMSNLNLSIAKRVPIYLPSIEEQKRIVNRVEKLFSLADKIEARYTKAKAQLDKLPQSLLAKAFRGELVPQYSTDEPASVLLERIKKEKATPAGKTKKLKRYEIEEEKLSLAAESTMKYNSP